MSVCANVDNKAREQIEAVDPSCILQQPQESQNEGRRWSKLGAQKLLTHSNQLVHYWNFAGVIRLQ